VGNPQPIPVDVRVIAATNVALEKALETGQFRADLYYRLNVLNLTIPPLREREGDVEFLAQFFLTKFSGTERTRVKGFSRQALHTLNPHPWPGNVRELINRVRRATVMCEERLISTIDLGLEKRQRRRSTATLEETRATAEQEAISYALRRNGNNITQAAADLGVSRMTLYRLMARDHLLKSLAADPEETAGAAGERPNTVRCPRT
jgi:transcriptional regulator with PAS, ATPase and Fis domain